jgi:hypothetical protein
MTPRATACGKRLSHPRYHPMRTAGRISRSRRNVPETEGKTPFEI